MAFTFFFRDQHVLEIACRHFIPFISGRSRPRIWDAGCAMGQEPYTLAILLFQQMSLFGFNNLRILATDIDESGQFGEIVSRGEYSKDDVGRMPPGVLEKCFAETAPGRFRVIDRIRSRVEYRRHDLLSLQPPAQEFSLVVCKNVLLHFTASERVEVLRMFHEALSPGGLLVTEQTQKMPAELAGSFERLASDGQLYRKVDADRAGTTA